MKFGSNAEHAKHFSRGEIIIKTHENDNFIKLANSSNIKLARKMVEEGILKECNEETNGWVCFSLTAREKHEVFVHIL